MEPSDDRGRLLPVGCICAGRVQKSLPLVQLSNLREGMQLDVTNALVVRRRVRVAPLFLFLFPITTVVAGVGRFSVASVVVRWVLIFLLNLIEVIVVVGPRQIPSPTRRAAAGRWPAGRGRRPSVGRLPRSIQSGRGRRRRLPLLTMAGTAEIRPNPTTAVTGRIRKRKRKSGAIRNRRRTMSAHS